MPAPDQIDPSYSRERMTFENDEQYAERMKRLDELAAFFASIPVKQSPYGDFPGKA